MLSNTARTARADLVADIELRGVAFGVALADVVDGVVRTSFEGLPDAPPWAVLALGSYARRELVPASDVDVMLLHRGGRRGAPSAEDAGALWYPLWDAGFVLGQSVRSLQEALALADDNLDALTALLDVRLVAGDRDLAAELVVRMHSLAPRRRGRLVGALAAAAAERSEVPGAVAEMLEPDLKKGAGGLRDLQAPGWAGWTLPGETRETRDAGDGGVLDGRGWDGGVARLVARGYLQPEDPERLRDARERFLDARVALQRVSGGRSDRLPLQDQDAVAGLLGAGDADEMVRALGEAARAVVWITRDLWARMLAAQAGPTGLHGATRALGSGVTLRDGQIAFSADAQIDTSTVLHAATDAARLRVPFERAALRQLQACTSIEWNEEARDAFVDLLATGEGAVAVFETLDYVGLLVPLLPEWSNVRARPQRNAYHRYTVDRHSLEAVVQCAALLDDHNPAGAGFDGEVARQAPRDVLLLAALLHDIAKGQPGDHSEVGEAWAREVGERIGLDAAGVDDLGWLVRHHLLLAETATRRDLGDPRTITRYAEAVGTANRNRLLYSLTIGDSRATGPAAWNASKAALVRELFVRTEAHLGAEPVVDEGPDHLAALASLIGHDDASAFLAAMPVAYARAFAPAELAYHQRLLTTGDPAVEWTAVDGDRWRCTVVEPDRTGLLATAAGALALVGLDTDSAAAYGHSDGLALEVFTGRDRFDRLATPESREVATTTITDALRGALPLDEQLRDRARRYQPAAPGPTDRDVRVLVDTDASASATVVEVHAPDDVGLLARVASVFVDLDLDVTQAIVSTVGDRVVDVFYLDNASGTGFADRHAVASLRATLRSRLTAAVTLDERSMNGR